MLERPAAGSVAGTLLNTRAHVISIFSHTRFRPTLPPGFYIRRSSSTYRRVSAATPKRRHREITTHVDNDNGRDRDQGPKNTFLSSSGAVVIVVRDNDDDGKLIRMWCVHARSRARVCWVDVRREGGQERKRTAVAAGAGRKERKIRGGESPVGAPYKIPGDPVCRDNPRKNLAPSSHNSISPSRCRCCHRCVLYCVVVIAERIFRLPVRPTTRSLTQCAIPRELPPTVQIR